MLCSILKRFLSRSFIFFLNFGVYWLTGLSWFHINIFYDAIIEQLYTDSTDNTGISVYTCTLTVFNDEKVRYHPGLPSWCLSTVLWVKLIYGVKKEWTFLVSLFVLRHSNRARSFRRSPGTRQTLIRWLLTSCLNCTVVYRPSICYSWRSQVVPVPFLPTPATCCTHFLLLFFFCRRVAITFSTEYKHPRAGVTHSIRANSPPHCALARSLARWESARITGAFLTFLASKTFGHSAISHFTIHPTDIRALSLSVDPQRTFDLSKVWRDFIPSLHSHWWFLQADNALS